jgi:sulfite exporter TauE/SafE
MPVERSRSVTVALSDPLLIAAAAGASFLTGLGGSGHCALMCGPLACVGLSGDRSARWRVVVGWHAARIAAYGVVGVLLGLLGHAGFGLVHAPAVRVLPWIMVAGLLLSAAEVGRRLPAIPGLARIPAILAAVGLRLSPVARGAVRGAATPFLPCGLLYGAFVLALGTGSPVAGAVIMLAFSLGAVPALALVQFGAPRLAGRPAVARAIRRAIPLLAAAVVTWRTLGSTGAGSPHCH